MPKDCRQAIGRSKWTEPGGTLWKARVKVPGFIARTDAEIREARGERLMRIGAVDGWEPGDLADEAGPNIGIYLDEGTPNSEYESLFALAEAVHQGKANTLFSTEGLLQARRRDREPAARTFDGWVKTLNAFMAFTEHIRPFQCIRADALTYKDHLLG